MKPIVLNTPEEIKKFLDKCTIKTETGFDLLKVKFMLLYPNMNHIHMETKVRWEVSSEFEIESITISRRD